MKNIYRFLIALALVAGLHNSANACSPVQVPTLTSWNVTGCNLNLNWTSNTIYPCQYYVQVELICNSATFLGNGNPPYYISPTITMTTPPLAYPATQVINICNLCAGTVYKFRARECYAAVPTICSAWTITWTFTTPGTFVQPTLNVTASPNLICVPQTSQLNCTVINGCGPTAPTFSWAPATGLSNTGIANPVASPTGTTTYTCFVTGGQQGCWTAQAPVTITATVPPIAGTASVAPSTICAGSTVTLTLTGYTGTIQWQSGPTSVGPWTNIPGATTTPYVTGPQIANICFQAVVTGCGTVTSNAVCVTVNPAPVANAGTNAQICLGQSTTLNGSGGGTYAWSPGGSLSSTTVANPVATPTVTTTYTLTVTQAGCTSTANVTVTVNPVQNVTLASTNPTCTCNGSITATVTGGNGPFTYLWNPSFQTTLTATGLCAGTYTITVTSANGCTKTATVTLNQPPALIVSIPTSSNVTCFGLCNGTANVSVIGGTLPYTYVWTPVAVGPNPTNLCAGTYTVSVTDANGCNGTATVTLTQPTQLTTSIAGFAATCNGQCNGQAVVIPSGGTLPYSYMWSPSGGTTPSATGLCAGNYTCTITDGNACSITATATVTQPPALVLSTTTTASTCSQPNGSATATVTGGTGPYNYSWAPSGGNTANATGLVPNTYTIYITDANGCTANTTAIVANSAGPNASVTASVNPTCFGGCNGTATVTVTGGVGPYGYAWSPSGGNAATGTGLCAGTFYICTVTDANGCTDTATVTLTQPPQLIVTAGPPVTICNSQSTTLTAVGSGGTPAYVYSWAPGGPTVNPTVTTVYTVYITDANGCTGTPQTVTVTVNPPLNIVAGAPVSICIGASTPITALGSGGNGGPYTYNWMPGNLNGQTVTVTPTATTTYTVTLTDNCGTPSVTTTVTVTVNPLPIVSFSGIDTAGCAPLLVTFTNNTTGSVNCSWNFGDGGTSNSCGNPVSYTYTTPGGPYNVFLQVTDANGCVASSTHPNMVTVYSQPVSCFTFGPQPTTVLQGDINFTDCSTGGATQWTWSFGDLSNSSSNQQNPTFTYTDTGTFVVQQTVCNNNGCCDSSAQTVVIGPDFTLYVPNAFTPDGDGSNDDFYPKGEGFDMNTYKLWIFDRWGNLIFFTDNFNKHWDGKVQGASELVQEDTYVWKIQINDYMDKKHQYVGHVSMIR